MMVNVKDLTRLGEGLISEIKVIFTILWLFGNDKQFTSYNV